MRCDRSGVPLGVPSGVTRVTAGLAWVLLPRRVRLGYYLDVSYGIFRKLQSLLLLILVGSLAHHQSYPEQHGQEDRR